MSAKVHQIPLIFFSLIDLLSRSVRHNKPVHVINYDITDNQEEAILGAKQILQLVGQIEDADFNLEDAIEKILLEAQEKTSLKMLYAVYFY